MTQILRLCILNQPYRGSRPDDLPAFFAACEHEGLMGGLSRLLLEHGHADPEFVDSARERFRAQFFQYAQYQFLLEQIHVSLQQAGAEALLLKGAALNLGLYAPGIRHVSDLDIFVPNQHLQTMETTLINLGFKQGPSASMWYRPGGLAVDVHGPGLGRTEEANGLDGGQLWGRSRATSAFPSYRILDEEDQIGYLACHALKHSYVRMVWLWDLWQLMRNRLEYSGIYSPAVEFSVQAVRWILQEIVGEAPGAPAGPELRGWQRQMLSRLPYGRCHPLGLWLLVGAQPGWKARAHFLRTALLDQPGMSWSYYAERIWRIVAAGFSQACRVFLAPRSIEGNAQL